MRFAAEWQDVRALGFNPPVPGSMANRLDLRQGYLELGAAEGAGWGLRIGRQALKYGKGNSRLAADLVTRSEQKFRGRPTRPWSSR